MNERQKLSELMDNPERSLMRLWRQVIWLRVTNAITAAALLAVLVLKF